MTPQEQAVCDHLASRKAAMVDLLGALVSIDSPSRDSAGVGAVIDTLEAFLTTHGVTTSTVTNDSYGKCLRAATAPARGEAPVLLMGHCDTVFPRGEVAKRPFRVVEGRAFGPGVADMKGGLVLNAFILDALAQAGYTAPVIGLFTADEEIASPWSRTIIAETCRGARAVLNSEAARPNGNFVTARKGGLFFRIEIQGKAAHSGANFGGGVSAVAEAAHKILALQALTDLDCGVTANPGVVGGGIAFNVVAPSAFIEAEVRYRSLADRDRLRARIQAIAETSSVPGTSARLILHGEFPPMEESAAASLQGLFRAAATEVGFATQGEFSGGCSDAGFTASAGVPTLCGVGPVGGLPHTEDEYLEIDSLVPRAQALALTIMRLGASASGRTNGRAG